MVERREKLNRILFHTMIPWVILFSDTLNREVLNGN
jgi:hypothetical protein